MRCRAFSNIAQAVGHIGGAARMGPSISSSEVRHQYDRARFSPGVFSYHLHTLEHPVHGFKIIPLNLQIADLTIPLGGFYPVMSQQVLDGDQVSIGVKKLCRHRVP